MDRIKKRKILIVEDYPNWRDFMVQLLEDEFDVTKAENYEEAINIIQNQVLPFHVIVADIRLRDNDQDNKDGLRLVEEVNRISRFTKAIVITGYPSVDTTKEAIRKLRVFEYLEKSPWDDSFDPFLFCKTVREAADNAEKEQNLFAFVLMPFAQKFEAIYQEVIKQTVEANGFICKRADDFYGPYRIMEDIEQGIRDAKFLIAILSGKNPNVFYEVGLAHAWHKMVLLLTESMDDIPPKLGIVRCTIYEDSLRGAEKLKRVLIDAINSLQLKDFETHSLFPEQTYQLDPKLCFALMPQTDMGIAVYEHIVKGAGEAIGLTCISAESVFSTRDLLDEIWKLINQAKVVIADLHGKDPDVFYLLGICHGLGKDVILLTRDLGDIPFDIKGRSYIIYSDKTFGEGNASKKELINALNRILGKKRPGQSSEKINTTLDSNLEHSSAVKGKFDKETPIGVRSTDNEQQFSKSKVDKGKLRQILTDYFNESELRNLCFDLSVDYDGLPGDSKDDKARELISYMERHGRLSELNEKCRELRPHAFR
jgi:ActR/RegA family two-component response regulator